MTNTVKQLKKRQTAIYTRQQELNALTEGEEARAFTDEEQTEWDNLEAEFQRNKSTIEKKELMRQRAAEFGKANNIKVNREGEAGEKKQLKKRYSIRQAIIDRADGKKLTGVEAEMQQEARKEFKNSNLTYSGRGVQVPAFMMMDEREQKQVLEERAALNVGTGSAGGDSVQTELVGFRESLRPNLVFERMGANVMTGLSGNIDFLKQTGKVSGSWLAETAAGSESNPTFGKDAFTPHRLATYSRYSRQLMYQSTISVEAFVRAELEKAIRENVEYAGIQGSGTDPVPRGLTNTSGIGSVAIGTNGGAPTFAKIIDLETEIKNDNYNGENLSYLTTPVMKGKLKQTQKFSGTNGAPVWEGNSMNGYDAFTTTQVPSALTKGTSTDCHAILFGDFSQMIIGQWGGLDLIVNPYEHDDEAIVKVTINSYWDIFFRYVEAFSAILDARNV
ncbi:MAG: phage major capsid protein [Flavobacteriaceae bacterium]